MNILSYQVCPALAVVMNRARDDLDRRSVKWPKFLAESSLIGNSISTVAIEIGMIMSPLKHAIPLYRDYAHLVPFSHFG
jgi:hypothetical protein